ncbi:hypothetical protein VRU48_09715 [Pedobacter sp. KR3-3]|uniref:Transcriptional regulator n=1 Tax=Pedobacter albus TaxID=3113905 RepID=A0ABU7I7D2_9SPHI|nr:hypothetical protein [Pedobacter sp. KR3-3]MEE1945385.1 hypothetical protein [Pedobacter sp. KR3-3]
MPSFNIQHQEFEAPEALRDTIRCFWHNKRAGTTIGDLMHDGQGIPLDYANSASLKALALPYHKQLKYISRKAKNQLGLSAVLVRPDGFIAWACEGEPDGNELEKAIARWFKSHSDPEQ